MSSTMPSRSVLDNAQPGNRQNADAGALPSGISVSPARPGVSPISGIPVSEIPGVSRGTTPLGPRIETPPATTAVEATARAANSTPPAGVNAPDHVAAHPQTNTQIGMGATVVVPTPPPAPQPETAPAAMTNDLGQVWVAGHHSWVGGQWTWVEGTWQRPPEADAVWAPGYYDAQNKRWTEGHWERGGSPAARAKERAAPTK